MITQKPISLKIDFLTLEELDKELSLGYYKRNTAINQAIVMYLRVMDARRRIRSYASLDDKERVLKELCSHLVPESATFDVLRKYIPSKPSKEELYDQATLEACNTDCPCYAHGTCPYPYKDKIKCTRFRIIYNEEEE